jgi:DNA polymerase-1
MSRLVLIDGHAILHRAYHAYPPLTTSQGELVGAVYGFTSILLTVLAKLHPEYVAVTFDLKEPTFRHKQFKAYKAHRKPMEENLVNQIPRVHRVVEALNIPIFEVKGYEADDVIGTLAKQAVIGARDRSLESSLQDSVSKGDHGLRGQNANISSEDHFAPSKPTEVIIVTGDQDALQLVNNKVKVYMPARGKIPEQVYNPEKVMEKYGLTPKQIIDFKAIAGDPSDGIPGVSGIGPKTAKSLLKDYRTLENIYNNLDKLPEGIAKKLRESKEQAEMSYQLATIDINVPIEFKLDCCQLSNYDKQKVIDLFEELEFRSLIKKLPNDGWEEMVEDTMGIKTEKDKSKQMGLF